MTEKSSEAELAVAKIAIILREDLQPWQRLNVAAFTISGVAAQSGALGEDYTDGSGNRYLPMFQDPVLVFGATAEEMARTVDRARSRDVAFTVFTMDLFDTFNDADNRAAVAGVTADHLDVVGIAFRTDRKVADKILKGLKLSKRPVKPPLRFPANASSYVTNSVIRDAIRDELWAAWRF